MLPLELPALPPLLQSSLGLTQKFRVAKALLRAMVDTDQPINIC